MSKESKSKKIIGIKAIIDAHRRGRLLSITLDPSKRGSKSIKSLLGLKIPIYWEETQNGVEGVVDFNKKSLLDQHLDSIKDNKISTVLILDQVQDVGNFGSIIRSADAFSVDMIIIPNKNSVRVSDTAIKISAGSAANIPIFEVSNISRIIEKLKEYGFWVYGTSSHSHSVNYKVDYANKSCIVMGNEDKGIRKKTLELCDHSIYIPIRIESLNVAVATSIVLCERNWQISNK